MSGPADSVVRVLAGLAVRGVDVSLSPRGGLMVRPVSQVTAAERAFLAAHAKEIRARLELVATLSRVADEEPWVLACALELQHAADQVVDQSGVSGRDPIIDAGAERCVQAHARHDLSGVRRACETIHQRVKELTTTAVRKAA